MKESDCKDKPDDSSKDIESGKEKNATIPGETSQDKESQSIKEQLPSESTNIKDREDVKDKKPKPKTSDSTTGDIDKKDQEPPQKEIIE